MKPDNFCYKACPNVIFDQDEGKFAVFFFFFFGNAYFNECSLKLRVKEDTYNHIPSVKSL